MWRTLGVALFEGEVARPVSLHSHDLHLGHGAPRRARIWVATVLRQIVPPEGVRRENIADDLKLCVSELVTDALIANSTSATVQLRIGPGIIRLSVTDDVPRLADSRDPVLYAQLIGWGMVRALSQDCGSENNETGRELWVTFRDTSLAAQQVVGSGAQHRQMPLEPFTAGR
jgi:hypothetical protein